MVTDDNMSNDDEAPNEMTPLEFAHLGEGEVAYIRELSGARAAKLFGINSEIPANQQVYSLHAADGTPMAVSDSLDAIVESAWEHELDTVSLH